MNELTDEEKEQLIIRWLTDSVEYLHDLSHLRIADKIEKIKEILEIDFEVNNRRFQELIK